MLVSAEPGYGWLQEFKAIVQQLESFIKMYKEDKETSDHRLLKITTRFDEFTMDRADPKGTN